MLETIGTFAAKSLISFAAKKGLSKIFPNEKSFSKSLENVIQKSVDDYKEKYPIPYIHENLQEKFPFYDSQIIVDELLKLVFFEKDEFGLQSNNIIEALKNNTNIIPPDEKQINNFLDLFKKNVKADSELKSLAIEENYKEEIFKMSEKMNELLNRQLIQNIIPKEITPIYKIPKEDIVGREDDLKNLRKSLLENKKIALINGMGGIGKTTLASVYANEYYFEYSHIVWLTIENTLEQAIISNFSLINNLKIENVKSDIIVESCLNELRKLENEKPNLLILDNASKNLSLYYDKLPGPPHWHTLVTSRDRISPFYIIDLDFLNEEEAIELFKKYYKKYSDEEVKEIVNKVELHTLTIEILSKSAEKNHWNYENVMNALSINAKTGIEVKHSGNKDIERIKSYIAGIFDLSNIGEKEIWLLKQFVALPNEWIKTDFLAELMQMESLDWKDEFFSNLENLFEKGYLQKNEKLDSFKMHPVLSEVFLSKLIPSTDDLKNLIDSIILLLSVDDTRDNPIDKFKYILFGDSILKIFFESTLPEISTLQNNLSLAYKELGKYEKARDLLEKSLKLELDNFGENHPNVARCQSNLAVVLRNLGEYNKARDLLEKSLKSDLENFKEDHLNVVASQSNLALVYRDMGEYKKAQELLEKALNSVMKNFGENHPKVATLQSNLSLVYQALGDYINACDLLEKAFKSDLENFGEKHPKVVTRKSNLALVYKDLGDFERAKKLLENVLKSDIENFGEKHPNVATSQSNLALVYKEIGEYEKAKELLENALKSDIENFGEKHPSVANSKCNLASVYYDLVNYKEAFNLFLSSYQIYFNVFGDKHPDTKNAKEWLDLVKKKLGN
jgi:tetratricopeptide (TPR) repeat protein